MKRAVLSAAAILLTAICLGCSKQSKIELADPPVLVLSADNQRIAWVERTGKGAAAMAVNGRLTGAAYDEISLIVMSPDGTRVAYAARRGAAWRMVLDGREIGPECAAVSPTGATFSRDGRRLAYGAWIKDRWYAIVDGRPAVKEGHPSIGAFAFSPDGRRFAYVAGAGDQRALVTDGVIGPSHDVIGDPVWSPDGKHLAFAAADGEKKFHRPRRRAAAGLGRDGTPRLQLRRPSPRLWREKRRPEPRDRGRRPGRRRISDGVGHRSVALRAHGFPSRLRRV